MDDLEPFYQYLERLIEIKYPKKVNTLNAGKQLISLIKNEYYSENKTLGYLFRYVSPHTFPYFNKWIKYATPLVNEIPEIRIALLIGNIP